MNILVVADDPGTIPGALVCLSQIAGTENGQFRVAVLILAWMQAVERVMVSVALVLMLAHSPAG